MNRWEEAFNQHPIHVSLEALHKGASKEFTDIDEDEVSEKRRLLKLITLYQEVLASLDPETVPFQQIDTLNKHLVADGINGQVEAYSSSGKVQHLINANNSLSNQLTPLAVLAGLSKQAATIKPAADLESLIDASMNSLTSKKEELDLGLKMTASALEDESEAVKQLETKVTELTSRVESQINDWQSQFSAAQESRSEKYLEWRDKFTEDARGETDTIIRGAEHDLNEAAEKYENDINELLTDGQSKHQKILELYELTAGDSVGAGYNKSAKTEGRQANFWRFASVIFIFFTALFLAVNFKHVLQMEELAYTAQASQLVQTSKEETEKKAEKKGDGDAAKSESRQSVNAVATVPQFSWYKLLLTFSLTGVLLWGSAYCAQQSTKHRRNEKRAKWFALEMKAIDPFISSFDEETKMEIKKELSARMFGKAYDLDDDHDKVVDEHMLNNIVATMIDKVKDIKPGS